MRLEEKDELPIKMLKHLYNFHLEQKGESFRFNQGFAREGEGELQALQYLEEKNLIELEFSSQGGYDAKITPDGINVIKNEGTLD